MTHTPARTDDARAQLRALLDSVERALRAAYTGSAEHGSFFRHGGGEYVPSVFMLINNLRREAASLLVDPAGVTPSEAFPRGEVEMSMKRYRDLLTAEQERNKWYRVCDEAWTAVDGTTLAEPDEWLPKAVRSLRERADAYEQKIDELRLDLEKSEQQIADLTRKLEKEHSAHAETVDQRDRAEHAADELAYAIADVDTIGEHSNTNNPWANALDELAVIQDRAEAWEVLNRCRELDQQKVAKLSERLAVLEAREEALRNTIDVFSAYAQHDVRCKAYLYPGIGKCGCGLSELRERLLTPSSPADKEQP